MERENNQTKKLENGFKDENLKLFRELKQTDDVQKRREIRDKIVNKNLRIVNFILKSYTNLLNMGSSCYPSYEDLQQEAVIGLIKAIDAFDENKNKNFSTFAGVCIKNQILILSKKFSCETKPNGRNTYSLQNAVCEERDGGVTYEDMVVDTKQDNKFLDAKLDLNLIQTKFLKTLTLKQKKVFKLLYIDNLHVSEIANKMNTCTQNISHCIERIKRKTRNFFEVSNAEINKSSDNCKNWSKHCLKHAENVQKLFDQYGKDILKESFVPLLSEKEKIFFDEYVLSYKGKSYAEIACVVGIDKLNVSKYATRIKLKLNKNSAKLQELKLQKENSLSYVLKSDDSNLKRNEMREKS